MARYHLCAKCITNVPADRPLCWFCTRTARFAEALRAKPCLRCRRTLPLDMFAGYGRFRVCDDCLLQYPMTVEERAESKRLSRDEYRRRNVRLVRHRAREYQRRRKAA